MPRSDVTAVESVLRERVVNGTTTTTVHYYLTSYAGTTKEIAEIIRGHWESENGLHWVPDVAFREDESRTCDLNAGANLALLRRVAVSLPKRVKAKGSIETRRLIAAWDDEFLLQVLQAIQNNHSALTLPPVVRRLCPAGCVKGTPLQDGASRFKRLPMRAFDGDAGPLVFRRCDDPYWDE
jgi:predicted transposase YbfD/YdcC